MNLKALTTKVALLLSILSFFGFANKLPFSDSSYINVIGFSKDGNYFAFERYGIHDGSAFLYSEIFIIDVCKNNYAIKSIQTTIEDSEKDTEYSSALNLKKASSALAQFKIINENKGTTAFSCNDTCTGNINFTKSDKKATISLEQFELPGCYNDQIQKKMKLTYKEGSISKVLQEDKTVPKSRNCPFSYEVEKIIYYQNKIAVIVRFMSPGFEGPDTRQIVVTGCL